MAQWRTELSWISADFNGSCLLVGADIVSERLGRGTFAESGGSHFVFAHDQQLTQGVEVAAQHCQSHIACKADFGSITTAHQSVA